MDYAIDSSFYTKAKELLDKLEQNQQLQQLATKNGLDVKNSVQLNEATKNNIATSVIALMLAKQSNDPRYADLVKYGMDHRRTKMDIINDYKDQANQIITRARNNDLIKTSNTFESFTEQSIISEAYNSDLDDIQQKDSTGKKILRVIGAILAVIIILPIAILASVVATLGMAITNFVRLFRNHNLEKIKQKMEALTEEEKGRFFTWIFDPNHIDMGRHSAIDYYKAFIDTSVLVDTSASTGEVYRRALNDLFADQKSGGIAGELNVKMPSSFIETLVLGLRLYSKGTIDSLRIRYSNLDYIYREHLMNKTGGENSEMYLKNSMEDLTRTAEKHLRENVNLSLGLKCLRVMFTIRSAYCTKGKHSVKSLDKQVELVESGSDNSINNVFGYSDAIQRIDGLIEVNKHLHEIKEYCTKMKKTLKEYKSKEKEILSKIKSEIRKQKMSSETMRAFKKMALTFKSANNVSISTLSTLKSIIPSLLRSSEILLVNLINAGLKNAKNTSANPKYGELANEYLNQAFDSADSEFPDLDQSSLDREASEILSGDGGFNDDDFDYDDFDYDAFEKSIDGLYD